jgi:hypothetical protein
MPPGRRELIYSALKKDMEAVAEAHGVGKTYAQASKVFQELKKAEARYSYLFGKDGKNSLAGNALNAIKSLEKGDKSGLVKMLDALPEAHRKEVVATAFNDILNGRPTGKGFDFRDWSNFYDALERNKLKSALMANLPPESQKTLENLASVSKLISNAFEKRAKIGNLAEFDTLKSRLWELAKRTAMNVAVGEGVGSAIGVPGVGAVLGVLKSVGVESMRRSGKDAVAKAIDRLLSSREFLNLAIKTSKGVRLSNRELKEVANTGAFRRFASAFLEKNIPSNREKLLRYLVFGKIQTGGKENGD